MGMEVPYELTGRRRQKSRTREALIAATRELMADGATPAVEDAAAAVGISRTTAYRYFPSQRALLLGAHPETLQRSFTLDEHEIGACLHTVDRVLRLPRGDLSLPHRLVL